VKAILWDLDDTLLDTLPGRMRALACAYQQCLGECVDPLALWRSHRGGTLEDLGRRLLGDGYARFTTAYRNCYYGRARGAIRPYDGIEPILAGYLEAGVPMAVVTSKVAWGATDELAEARLLQYFRAVVGFDDCDRHKPDPEPILTALERLVVDNPGEAVFVGDSPADMFAARNAGCRSIAALWGTLDAGLLLDTAPDAVAHHPRDVPHLAAARPGGPG
jgi:HAD superfamily hydrolase (TIGR01509 family)